LPAARGARIRQSTINVKKLRSNPVETRQITAIVRSMSPGWGRILESTAIAGFALISTFAVARIGLEPSDPSRAVGVIFAPWTDAGAAFTHAVTAGGRFIRFGGLSFVVVVEPDDPGYAKRVRDAGALLIVDPRILAACLSLASTAQVQR
jgi:hypothetical protein